MGQACQKRKYQRRQPELTPCYQIVQEELLTFLKDRELEGRPLPNYVIKEFDAYLKCGILAHGFLRLTCDDCKEEKLVAFSCKKRGFCPSCTGKRMTEGAAHLVDNILPIVPYRQFVVTFPFPMRYWLNTNKALFSASHKIITDAIQELYIQALKIPANHKPKIGIVSFTQRFGSALNLNPHLHIIVTDGAHYRPQQPIFRKLKRLAEKQVSSLLSTITERIIIMLKHRGFLDQYGEMVENPLMDSLFTESESIHLATQASLSGRIAFGPHAGQRVRRLGGGFGYYEEIPFAKGRLCYTQNGFSIHAARSINSLDRKGLEQLITYIARGPFSNDRLTLVENRQVKVALKRPFSDGSTHLLMTYSEFMEKLACLIPPPRSHLVRWSGSFAPNSKYRRKIILNPANKKGFNFENDNKGPRNYSWAKLLARVFGVDVLSCACGGALSPKGALKDPLEIERYLRHVGVDDRPPARAPPRRNVCELEFTESDEYEGEAVIYLD